MKNSPLNNNLKILDTTLRDGEQTPGVSLTPEAKIAIARKLDEFGVDIIEAGSAVTSPGEQAAIKAIAAADLSAEICSFTRIVESDIDAALSCGVGSIHLVVPTSDLHIEQKLKRTREQVLGMVGKSVDYAKAHGLLVELSAEDGSRTSLDFLKTVFKKGMEHKIDRACVCDTVGILTPEKTFDLYSELLESITVPLSVHCHDDLGLAVANSLSAIRAGASEVHCTVNGLGERAGNAALEEVVMALSILYGKKLRVKTEGIYELSQLVQRLSGINVAPTKSIVGGNAFTHKSGIHVDGILKNPETYEPLQPGMVGRRRVISLGKHAGTHGVESKLKEFGFDVDAQSLKEIVQRVKEMGDRGKTVTDADLMTITETMLGRSRKKVFEVTDVVVTSGKRIVPSATVHLRIGEREVVETATGDGPVDAAINAISKIIKGAGDFTLEEYHVDAITGGTDALVDVVVKVRKDDRTVTARGAGTDIIMASVDAMVEAINRLMI